MPLNWRQSHWPAVLYGWEKSQLVRQVFQSKLLTLTHIHTYAHTVIRQKHNSTCSNIWQLLNETTARAEDALQLWPRLQPLGLNHKSVLPSNQRQLHDSNKHTPTQSLHSFKLCVCVCFLMIIWRHIWLTCALCVRSLCACLSVSFSHSYFYIV